LKVGEQATHDGPEDEVPEDRADESHWHTEDTQQEVWYGLERTRR